VRKADSLVPFSSVLALLNSNFDWTQQLGYAFADQQAAVMNSVRLRVQAQAAGNLKATEQQIVRVEKADYRMKPARPIVVYVPNYNPMVVYRAWPSWQPEQVARPTKRARCSTRPDVELLEPAGRPPPPAPRWTDVANLPFWPDCGFC
jgi:hypothetical protein